MALSVTLNERGAFTFVVMPRGSPAPNAAQVRLGSSFGDAAAAGTGSVTLPLTPAEQRCDALLIAERAYDVYVGFGCGLRMGLEVWVLVVVWVAD